MHIDFRWIKDAAGTLDRRFIEHFAREFGLSAFVETGTYLGDTIANLAGVFDRLVSIELAPALAERARNRFAAAPNITIVEADSTHGLKDAFVQLNDGPALIWLDAHYSGGETSYSGRNTPVLGELDCILALRSNRDVILIDDVRYFWPPPVGFRDHASLHGYPLLSEVAQKLSSKQGGFELVLLGDVLLAIPDSLVGSYGVSAIAAACTASRLQAPGSILDSATELTIATATARERATILEIPPEIEAQKEYGLGGHFYYWRGLLHENDARHVDAASDFGFAHRCGVIPAARLERKL